MRKLIIYIFALCLFCSCSKRVKDVSDADNVDSDVEVSALRYEYGIAVDSFEVRRGVVGSGETLGGILGRVGADRSMISQLSRIDRDSFDVRLIRAGKEYICFYRDSLLEYFVYLPSRIESVVFHLSDSLHIEKQLKETYLRERYTEAQIESSLWNAMVGSGSPTSLAVELSEIYAWSIDFFGLQRGDKVKAIYDERYVDSISLGVNRVYASSFLHGGKVVEAYYFSRDSVSGYFDSEGKSLRKAFLKAPLNYKRISSTFTYARKHPIFKTVRPHTGVDYAAPAGTPVVALGDGKVIEKGYKGGGGNTIKIRHNSVYTTAYLHLQGYAKGLAVGKMVSQGEVIGYVGSTGHSTGPHLDFRVWKDGEPVNPLTIESPSAEPIPDDMKPYFDSVVVRYKDRLAF